MPEHKQATRILFVVASLAVGGAEKGVVSLLRGLDRQAFDVRVCCVSGAGPLAAEIKQLGVEIHVLGRHGRWDPTTWWRARRVVTAFKPDIVHAVQFTAGLWTAMPSRLSRVRSFVYSVHAMPSADRWYVRLLERMFIYPFAHQVLSVSRAAAQEFERRYPRLRKPVKVIANGVDTRKFAGTPRGSRKSPVVIAVGRLDPVKDFRTLIQAFSRVVRQRPDARLWIVGEGSERAALERQVQALDLTEAVEFLGYREDVSKLLQQADLFVSTSLSECLPNVHLEAMACGKAIVATNVGGVGEILDDTTAMLVSPGDVGAVATAITRLLGDRDFAQRLATAAKALVETEWDSRHRVRRMQSFYRDLSYSA